MSLPTIDHRGPEFGRLGLKILGGMQSVFQTRHPVVIYPASGTGAWEAALANTMSPGDHLLMYETGQFAALWARMASRMGLSVELLSWTGEDLHLPQAPGWRRGVHADLIERRLKADTTHQIKAVCVVHNETSTGATSDIAAVRAAIDAVRHPALLMVDTISGLASADYRHDAWGVDVSVGGSQKGLMLPPGISFNALSPRALEAARSARLPRSFWAWDEMLLAEGLEQVFARHQRWGAGVRAAVGAWGLPIQCVEPAARSPVLTGVIVPPGIDADEVRRLVYERFDLSLGTGLGKVKGRMFRIGHLGDSNDLTLLATLAGCEMGLKLSGVALAGSGVQAAMDHFATHRAGTSSSRGP